MPITQVKNAFFLVNFWVHPDQKLGTFDFQHQDSQICHLKIHLNTLLFQ